MQASAAETSENKKQIKFYLSMTWCSIALFATIVFPQFPWIVENFDVFQNSSLNLKYEK